MTTEAIKSSIFVLSEYLRYFLDRVDSHSLQSPFAYQLYKGVISHKRRCRYGDADIEAWRRRFLRDNSLITIKDIGAGSRVFSSAQRKISSIARYSCSPLSYNLLYQALCLMTPAKTVVELGTCLGINTSYLSKVTQGRLHTFEAASELLGLAKKTNPSHTNITFHEGDIHDTLLGFLETHRPVDFVLVDANHRYEPTLQYCKWMWDSLHSESIMVLGDIHWSPEMKRAWEELKSWQNVTMSIDFFECGVLFFRPHIKLEHLVLYYPR